MFFPLLGIPVVLFITTTALPQVQNDVQSSPANDDVLTGFGALTDDSSDLANENIDHTVSFVSNKIDVPTNEADSSILASATFDHDSKNPLILADDIVDQNIETADSLSAQNSEGPADLITAKDEAQQYPSCARNQLGARDSNPGG